MRVKQCRSFRNCKSSPDSALRISYHCGPTRTDLSRELISCPPHRVPN